MSNNIPQELKTFLEYVSAAKPVMDITAVREQLLATITSFGVDKVSLPQVIDRTLPLDGHEISVRIYHSQPTLTLPLIIYFHGGGHACGNLDTHDNLCRRIASACDGVVLAVDYRLAPEYPFPHGLNDCIAVFEQHRSLLSDINVNFDQLYLMGDSGGGNIAASVCAQAKGCNALKGLALIYPSTDFTLSHPSVDRYAQGYLLTKEKIEWYFDLYFSEQDNRQQASPQYFDGLDQFPRTYIAVAEYDPLYDEGVAFADQLQSCGVAVDCEVFDGMIHAFAHLETVVPESINQLVSSLSAFVNAE